MGRRGVHLTREWPDEPQVRAWIRTPHDDLVREAATDGTASEHPNDEMRFTQAHGPFRRYERTISARDGKWHERTEYELHIPWFAWLFAPQIGRAHV